MIKRPLLAAFVIPIFAMVAAAEVSLLPGLDSVTIGMSVQDLVQLRPDARFAKKSIPVEPEKMARGRYTLLETFPDGGDYLNASYWVEDGKLITVTMIGVAPPGKDAAIRRRLIKTGSDRWGNKFVRRAPEDSSEPGKAEAVLTWVIDGSEIVLTLPPKASGERVRPSYFSLSIRALERASKHPWRDMKMTAEQRKSFFRDHDVPSEDVRE